MKMVKSLLLGSAAGLMAVAGAQAADMPVKAAPVEYVKICSLYGAGFYYIPGTDICVKIGGWVRFQAFSGNNSNGTSIYFASAAADQNTRLWTSGSDFSMRARATISMDARSQTEWGTVRTYMNIGWTANSLWGGVNALGTTVESLYVNRGFIQWAGFTFGRAQSFYDFIPQSSFMYFANATHDTGDPATLLAAYTTQWGNGISTTLAVEESRVIGVLNTDGLAAVVPTTLLTANFPIGVNVNNDAVQQRVPDIVSNFRIDQAWGSFQVMSALHDASAAYWTAVGNNCGVPGPGGAVNINCGYPGDKWGWAAGVGATLNLPFIGKGDRFSFQVNTSEGATAYVIDQPGTRFAPNWWGGAYSIGAAWIQDAILRQTVPGVQNGSLELTKAWGFIAAFEHFWTPSLRTSWYGGGYEIDYNANATTYVCSKTALASTANGISRTNTGLCDPDSAVWFVGTRTQWNIRPDFYMGVDLLYSKFETAHDGAFANIAANGARPASLPNYKIEDQDALAVTFRIQRDIVP